MSLLRVYVDLLQPCFQLGFATKIVLPKNVLIGIRNSTDCDVFTIRLTDLEIAQIVWFYQRLTRLRHGTDCGVLQWDD